MAAASKTSVLGLLSAIAPEYRGAALARQAELDAAAAPKVEAPKIDETKAEALAKEKARDQAIDDAVKQAAQLEREMNAFVAGAKFGKGGV